MENNITEFFYIKDVELFTVLASFGVEKWYGLNTVIDGNSILENSQNEVINSLYQKGYISFNQEEAILTEDFSGIIETLLKSDVFLYIRRYQTDDPVLLFYLAKNNAVCVDRSINDDNTLRVSQCNIEQIKNFIMYKCMEEDIATIDEISEYKEFAFSEELTEEIIKEKNYITVIEKFNTGTGKMINRLMVEDLDVCYRLILQNESGTSIMNNDKENQEFVAKQFCD